MKPTIKSAQLTTDVRLTYAEQGDPEGMPVILLHGVTDSWRSFEPVLPHLPEGMRAVALTQREHGNSDRPASYRARDFAADVAAFMDTLAIDRAVIVGHSMGSMNALRFAIDHPERTAGLVLAGAFASCRDNPAVLEFWRSAIVPLRDPIDPAFAREFQESTLAQPVPTPFLDRMVQESMKVPARVWQAAFKGFLEDEFAHGIDQIKAPTLIVWGALDAFCRQPDQDALLKAIGGSRLITYENAGHALHLEEPRRFANDVARFVGNLSAANRAYAIPC